MNSNIKRIANNPARPILRGGALEQSVGQRNYLGTVSLSPNLHTIFDLLDEWKIGIGGRKPAKDFTAAEQGKVKFKFCRMKVVWDGISKLVKSCMTAHTAI